MNTYMVILCFTDCIVVLHWEENSNIEVINHPDTDIVECTEYMVVEDHELTYTHA